jgi:hypothetical protein
MRRSRRAALALALLALLAGTVGWREYARGAAFVAEAAQVQGFARSFAQWQLGPVDESAVTIPWRGGELPGRRYQPRRTARRVILLVPGIHAAGIEEPRLVGFARDLAAIGHPVITAGVADLAAYRITTRATDMIEDAATWIARQPNLAPDGRIGMMGISFAGGLSIVAAGRPGLRDRVQFVLSFGGHGDLPRTLRYLATGVQPDGAHRPPHDYGVAIILLGVADRVVPPDQAEPLREAILTFLEASRLAMVDKDSSAREFEHARELATNLHEPARTLMQYVNTRDVVHLGPVLLPHLAVLGGDPALSPERSEPPACTVYLLHGTDDNVIPSVESVLLARHLVSRGVTVHQLATPLITHAEVDRSAAWSAALRLVGFWSDLLGE